VLGVAAPAIPPVRIVAARPQAQQEADRRADVDVPVGQRRLEREGTNVIRPWRYTILRASSKT